MCLATGGGGPPGASPAGYWQAAAARVAPTQPRPRVPSVGAWEFGRLGGASPLRALAYVAPISESPTTIPGTSRRRMIGGCIEEEDRAGISGKERPEEASGEHAERGLSALTQRAKLTVVRWTASTCTYTYSRFQMDDSADAILSRLDADILRSLDARHPLNVPKAATRQQAPFSSMEDFEAYVRHVDEERSHPRAQVGPHLVFFRPRGDWQHMFARRAIGCQTRSSTAQPTLMMVTDQPLKSSC